MNMNKIAFFSASLLIFGASTLSASSFAADAPAKKPAASKSIAKPDTHDMKDHCDEHEAAMMSGNMGGMQCDHKDGKMCVHKDGMKCEHMAGGKMEGMKCDHMHDGKMEGHMGSMMEDNDAGTMMESSRMDMVMSLNLSDEQRSKVNKLSDELKHDNWATMGQIMDESTKLRDLYAADRPDPSAIGKIYQKMFDMQRQMIEATIAAENRAEELLTPEQHTKVREMRRKEAAELDYLKR